MIAIIAIIVWLVGSATTLAVAGRVKGKYETLYMHSKYSDPNCKRYLFRRDMGQFFAGGCWAWPILLPISLILFIGWVLTEGAHRFYLSQADKARVIERRKKELA
jgi:hypothetical protein